MHAGIVASATTKHIPYLSNHQKNLEKIIRKKKKAGLKKKRLIKGWWLTF